MLQFQRAPVARIALLGEADCGSGSDFPAKTRLVKVRRQDVMCH